MVDFWIKFMGWWGLRSDRRMFDWNDEGKKKRVNNY